MRNFIDRATSALAGLWRPRGEAIPFDYDHAPKRVPGLPTALIVGDSISVEYTLAVRHLLQGRFNVERPPTNCLHTDNILANLDAWLADGPFDVVHFNSGLHDLREIDGGPQVPPERYAENLSHIAGRLQRAASRLIFATTTPVPEGAAGRPAGREAVYNEAARSALSSRATVNDLHAVVARYPAMQRKADVHMTPLGYDVLAYQVAKAIES